MAAKIPTQNNLGEVIKALNENLTAFRDLMDVVVGILDDKSVFVRKDFNKRMKMVKKNIKLMFGDEGPIMLVWQMVDKITKENDFKTTFGDFDKLVMKVMMKTTVQFIKDLAELKKNIRKAKITGRDVKILQKSLKNLEKINNLLKDFVEKSNSGDVDISAAKDSVKSTKVMVGNIALIMLMLIGIALLSVAFLLVSPIIILGMRGLAWVARAMTRAAQSMPEVGGLRRIKRFLYDIGVIAVMLLIIGAVALVVAKLVVPILIMFGMIILVMLGVRVMAKIIGKIINVEVSEGLSELLLILGVIFVITIMLLVMSLIAMVVAKTWKGLLILFGIIMIVSLAAIGLGLAMAALIEVVPFMILGMGALMVIIGMVFLMAVMLLVLQYIKLDKEKILANVKMVIGVAKEIIACLFEDEGDEKEQNDNLFTKLIKILFKGAGMIIEAILAAWILAATFVSVTFILLIASELWLLQGIKLNKDAILNNVGLVLGTAKAIIKVLFGDDEGEDENKEKPNFLETLIKHVAKGLVMLIDAILACLVLLWTTISVLFILIIAGMLWLLQKIELNPEKVKANVGMVLGTAKAIINTLFGDDEKEEENKEKPSFLEILLNKVLTGFATLIQAILACLVLLWTTISVGLILLMANMLKKLQEIDLDRDKVEKNVGMVLGTAHYIIDKVFAPREEETEDGDSEGVFGKLIRWAFGDAIADILKALLAIVFLALTMVAIGIVLKIAHHLKDIQDLELDEATITTKVDAIMRITFSVMRQIFDFSKSMAKAREDEDNKSILSWAFPQLGAILDALLSIAFLGLAMISIGIIVAIARHMKEIQEIDLNTDVIQKNTEFIVSQAVAIADKIDTGGSFFSNLFKSWSLGTIADMFEAIKTMGEGMEYLATLDEVAIANAKNNAGDILRVLDYITNWHTEDYWDDMEDIWDELDDALDEVDDVVSRIKKWAGVAEASKDALTSIIYVTAAIEQFANGKFSPQAVMGKALAAGRVYDVLRSWLNVNDYQVRRHQELTENTIKFLDKVQNMDIEKLKTTEKLFKNMARFSESINGNFQSLADALNDKIAPVIEELNQKIEDVKALQAKAIDTTAAGNGDKEGAEGQTQKTVANNKGAGQVAAKLIGGTPANANESYKAAMKFKDTNKAILAVLTGSAGDGVHIKK